MVRRHLPERKVGQMRKTRVAIAVVLASMLLIGAFGSGAAQSSQQSCWGQATKAFAQMGVMGEHASEFDTPRLGLRNLARALYEQGVIADDSMQALGSFVADELGLSVEACN
jgi:hypothetical protein